MTTRQTRGPHPLPHLPTIASCIQEQAETTSGSVTRKPSLPNQPAPQGKLGVEARLKDCDE